MLREEVNDRRYCATHAFSTARASTIMHLLSLSPDSTTILYSSRPFTQPAACCIPVQPKTNVAQPSFTLAYSTPPYPTPQPQPHPNHWWRTELSLREISLLSLQIPIYCTRLLYSLKSAFYSLSCLRTVLYLREILEIQRRDIDHSP